jgi:hypothetical protein
MKSPAFLLSFVFLSLTAFAQDAARTLRVYFVGNSVTDTIRYEPGDGLEDRPRASGERREIVQVRNSATTGA